MHDQVKERVRDLMDALREHTELEDYAPVRDRVVILPIREEAGPRGPAGLYVPAEEKHWRAVVVAVGPGRRIRSGDRIPPDVQPGDVVIVGANVGEPVESERTTYRWCKGADIMAVLAGGDE